jgi:hypothetical protein
MMYPSMNACSLGVGSSGTTGPGMMNLLDGLQRSSFLRLKTRSLSHCARIFCRSSSSFFACSFASFAAAYFRAKYASRSFFAFSTISFRSASESVLNRNRRIAA